MKLARIVRAYFNRSPWRALCMLIAIPAVCLAQSGGGVPSYLNLFGLQINSAGSWTPGQQSLYVTGTSGYATAKFVSSPTSGSGFGPMILGGTNSSDWALNVQSQSGAQFFEVYGDGGTTVGSPTGGDEGLGSINAQALYVQGVAVGGKVTYDCFLTADYTVTASNTLANTACTVTLPVGQYSFELYASFYDTTAVDGAKFGFGSSGTSTIGTYNGSPVAVGSVNGAVSAVIGTITSTNYTTTSIACCDSVTLNGTVNVTVAGTTFLQAAQTTSGAGTMHLASGTSLVFTKL